MRSVVSHLRARTRSLPLLRLGAMALDPVWLRAHVLRISQVYGPAMLGNDPQVRANARTVECVLAFDQPQNLRIGLRVLVRFDAAATPEQTSTPAKD